HTQSAMAKTDSRIWTPTAPMWNPGRAPVSALITEGRLPASKTMRMVSVTVTRRSKQNDATATRHDKCGSRTPVTVAHAAVKRRSQKDFTTDNAKTARGSVPETPIDTSQAARIIWRRKGYFDF